MHSEPIGERGCFVVVLGATDHGVLHVDITERIAPAQKQTMHQLQKVQCQKRHEGCKAHM